MKGSCLCGAVEYEVDQLDMPITHCHCHSCRKAHAAAYASNAGVNREHFRWLKGKEKLTAFESSPGKLHILEQREHLFWANVNSDSEGT